MTTVNPPKKNDPKFCAKASDSTQLAPHVLSREPMESERVTELGEVATTYTVTATCLVCNLMIVEYSRTMLSQLD